MNIIKQRKNFLQLECLSCSYTLQKRFEQINDTSHIDCSCEKEKGFLRKRNDLYESNFDDGPSTNNSIMSDRIPQPVIVTNIISSQTLCNILCKVFIDGISLEELNIFQPKIKQLIGIICNKRLGGLRNLKNEELIDHFNDLTIKDEFNNFMKCNPKEKYREEEKTKIIVFAFLKSFKDSSCNVNMKLFEESSFENDSHKKKLKNSMSAFRNILTSGIVNFDYFLDIVFKLQKDKNSLSNINDGWRSQRKLKTFIRTSKFIKYLFYLDKDCSKKLDKFLDQTIDKNFFTIYKNGIRTKFTELSKNFADILNSSVTEADIPYQFIKKFKCVKKIKLPFSMKQIKINVKEFQKNRPKWKKFKDIFELKQSHHYSSNMVIPFQIFQGNPSDTCLLK